MKKLNQNLEELMTRVGSQDRVTRLVTEGLPLLIHFQVCEAVNQVIKSHGLRKEF